MRRLFVGLLLLFVFMFVFSGLISAVDVTTTPGTTPTGWAGVIQAGIALMMTVITAYLIPYLKSKAAQARAQASKDDQEVKELLWVQLKKFLFDGAEAIVERQFLRIAEAVKVGELKTPADVKRRLNTFGQELRSDALQYFNVRGVDLLREVGNDTLDSLIEQAANAVSPFPGKDTAKTFLQGTVADAIIDYGIAHVRDLFGDISVTETLLKATKPSSTKSKSKSKSKRKRKRKR